MLINTLTWRKDLSVDNIFDEEFDRDIFNESVGCIYKQDKEGRPVIYNFYGGIDQDKVFGVIDRFIRWRIQLLEEAIKCIDFINTDATTQVHGYNGASIFGRTANTKEAANKLIQITKDYYPGLLETKLFVNVPWWGSQIYKLLSPLLSEATLKRFTLCSSYELEETLAQHIDKENWPPVYQANDDDDDT